MVFFYRVVQCIVEYNSELPTFAYVYVVCVSVYCGKRKESTNVKCWLTFQMFWLFI